MTWPSAIAAKAMLAITLDVPHKRDVVARNLQTAATAPTTTATGVLHLSTSFAFGILASEGPASDTAPTLDNSYTAGQRVGTGGAPPASNITLLEGYKVVTDDCAAQTLSGTGATSRDWVNGVCVFKEVETSLWDKNGSEIEIGDFVMYQGTEREVLGIMFQRNTVTLAVVGNASATECEVMR